VQGHLVGVEREDLLLRVPLFELHGEDRLLDLALERPLVHAASHVTSLEEQVARELLGDRARAGALPRDDVLHGGHEDARDAEPEVLLEVGVFRGKDGLAEDRGDLVVAHDHAALGGEFADDLAVGGQQTRNGVGAIVVESANLGEVVRKRQEHAAHRTKPRNQQEKERHRQAAGQGPHGLRLAEK
jgi:hypothetical protein